MATIEEEVTWLAERAAQAAKKVALTTGDERNAALRAMASALRERSAEILAANARDMAAAEEAKTKESLLDRLLLTPERVESMAAALEELVELDDPLGRVLEKRTLYNGLELEKISVPLGVVAVVYEARPNVTADAAGICLKSGNACILRGGSLAAASNEAIADALSQAAASCGMPEGAVSAITTTDREATDVLMSLHGLVDVLIPRGGAGLIRHCVECSRVPVIETGTGNCHVYVHESADFGLAHDIVMNAKCRRYGVCNAAESLLVDASCAEEFLPRVLPDLAERGVMLHCDGAAGKIAEEMKRQGVAIDWQPATEYDWETEYLAPELAVKCVSGESEAIEHINAYGTRHSEAIVARDEKAIERFLREVDAAVVYANTSTAFTDGGQFGLGAEIGISTQKLHTRGPFALEALTSYKYVVRGNGQVRA